MSTVETRGRSPLSTLVRWLESEQLGTHPVPSIRLEDFVEDDHYVLRAEVPGIDPAKDLDVSVDGERLVIRCERREEVKEKNLRELHYGSFSRSVPLPHGAVADQVTAEYADGVVTVTVPLAADPSEARRVTVRRADNGEA